MNLCHPASRPERIVIAMARVPLPNVPPGAWALLLWLWLETGGFPTRREIAARFGITADTATSWLCSLAGVNLLTKVGRSFSVNEMGVVSYLGERGIFVDWSPENRESPRDRGSGSAAGVTEAAADSQLTDDAFVQQVVGTLKFYRIPVRADLDGELLLQLRAEGMTPTLAGEAAMKAHRAARRRLDYWVATVRGMLSDARELRHGWYGPGREQANDGEGATDIVDIRDYQAGLGGWQ